MLAERGASVIAHLNDARGDLAAFDTWRAMLISRAAENQRFVVSANASAHDQHSPSIVIAPDGRVLAELPTGTHDVVRAELHLSEVSDWYLGRRRSDLTREGLLASDPWPTASSRSES